MSKTTKRKFVTKEVEEEFRLPTDTERVVKIAAGRGNNLHEVMDPQGNKYLVSMPTKFRKNVWIKRGDYVLVDDIPEGDKVKAEITTILYKEQIKYLKTEGRWPEEFGDSSEDAGKESQAEKTLAKLALKDSSDSDDDDDDLFKNTNRPIYSSTEDSDSSEEESDDNDGADDDEGKRSDEDDKDGQDN